MPESCLIAAPVLGSEELEWSYRVPTGRNFEPLPEGVAEVAAVERKLERPTASRLD